MKRQLRYADISELDKKEQEKLLGKLRSKRTIRKFRTVRTKVDGAWTTMQKAYDEVVPDLIVWTAEVQGNTILYGYMHQEECPVPFMDRSLPKQPRQKPVRENGGLLTEEEYKLCLR